MKKFANKAFIAHGGIIMFFALALLISSAGAYETYSAGCKVCHGGFTASTYNSMAAAKAASPGWVGGLHSVHRNGSTSTPPGMLNSNCNACHFGSSKTPVYINQSNAAAPFNQSCSGCHDGPGLRAHHVNAGADTCYDCHSNTTPDPENVLRPVYAAAFGTASGTTRVNDPCNPSATGFEGRLADVTTLGLDNDGNGLYDQNDPACAPAPDTTPPTVTAFTIPSTSTTLTVSITTFTASDNVGVTGYMATEGSIKPSASASGWSAFAPASYTFATAGAKSLYAWAKDAAGNVSASLSGSVTISIQLLPVRVLGSTTAYHSSLQSAYTAAANGDTIQARAVDFAENFNLNRSISISLKGGYDSTYTTNSLNTTVTGSLTVSGGTVTIENIVIQ